MTEPPPGPLESVHVAFEFASPVLVFLEGEPLTVTACNAAARARLGVQDGDPARQVLEVTGLDDAGTMLDDVRSTGEAYTVLGAEVDLLDDEGLPSLAQVDLEATPVRADDDSVRGVVLSCVDTTATTDKADARGARAARQDVREQTSQGLVTSLQDAMSSQGLPLSPGVELAAHYLIAESRAGGDWFDAIALDDGRVVLVVGDVSGYGLDATVVASELRAVFDEQVRATTDLGETLAALDRRAQRAPATRAATLCAALLDPTEGLLTYCTAGHAPPLVVSRDGTPSYLPPSAASPLGMGRPFPVLEHRLAPGDLLVLYSDGLLVRPDHPPEEGTLDLIRRAAEVTHRGSEHDDERRPADGFSYELLEAATRDGYSDDVTLLAARLVEPVSPLTLQLTGTPTTLRDARRSLGEWLRRLQVRRLDESALQHSVGELLSNALEHAYGRSPMTEIDDPEARVELVATHTPDGSIEVVVTDHGTWRPPTRTTERGRGLAMVRGLCDDFELTVGPEGTRARLRHRPTWDVALLTGMTLDPPPPSPSDLEVVVPRDGLLLLRGRIEKTAVDRLHHLLGQYSQGGTLPLLVDLTQVTILSSAAIHVLATAQAWTAELQLVAPVGSPSQQMLDRAGLPHLSAHGHTP